MTKAERKAALKAAKKAAKEEKKATVANGGNDKPEVKTETKKAENTQQVAAQTVTNETSAKKGETKKEEKPQATQKEQKKEEKAPSKKKEPKIPTIIPEDASKDVKKDPAEVAIKRATSLVNAVDNVGIPIGSTSSSLDGKAMLSFVMQQRYANNKELAERYPEMYADINRNIDVVTLLALVDVRQDLFNRGEKGELELQIDANQIMPLQSMAEMLGIKLAPAKALPGNDKQLSIDFTKSEVPDELSKDAGTSSTKEEKVELDPNKITSDDMVNSALEHIIKNGKNMAENIVNIVEWYRTYCITKEENADKKLALDDRTTAEWLEEIFTRIKPVSLLQGLGRAVYLYTSQTGSPCSAHAILHTHMSKAGWSEEQIAGTLKALIGENFRYKLKDDNTLKPTEDKALNAIVGNLGTEYIDKIFADYNLSNETINSAEESKKSELENNRSTARKVLGILRTNYFPKEHKPTDAELRMVVGQIINLYRNPADRLAEYCGESISSPKESEFPASEKKN